MQASWGVGDRYDVWDGRSSVSIAESAAHVLAFYRTGLRLLAIDVASADARSALY